jgi:site-specific DNA-methyltransferase (adenine-specific)
VNGQYELMLGDCLEVLRGLPDNSVDSIVTDPPYGLGKKPDALKMLTDWIETGHHDVKGRGFMGKEWDAFVPQPRVWHECLRVLKPGGHLLAFAGTRTQDLMTLGLRLAGFEIRDMVAWVYGSGFPKSMDVSKALDKMAGAEREVVGASPHAANRKADMGYHGGSEGEGQRNITAPTTEAAKQWDGWGTALKPALEPITLARKPLEGTVAANVLKWHTGALNIDGCRVGSFQNTTPSGVDRRNAALAKAGYRPGEYQMGEKTPDTPAGRWPANLIHDGSEEVLEGFPNSNGSGPARVLKRSAKPDQQGWGMNANASDEASLPDAGSGSAARFFYCAKTSKTDRSADNNHPTVKPTDLMRYLCRLITPPDGVVLDPYAGSGSTGKAALFEGFKFIGIERDPEYFQIAQARIEAAFITNFCADL